MIHRLAAIANAAALLMIDLLIVKPALFKSDVARRPTGVRLVPAMPLNP